MLFFIAEDGTTGKVLTIFLSRVPLSDERGLQRGVHSAEAGGGDFCLRPPRAWDRQEVKFAPPRHGLRVLSEEQGP